MYSRKSFTLVEMLIVIVIIGILAAALIPRITGIQARARDTARVVDAGGLAEAMKIYYLDYNGTYPSDGLANKSLVHLSSISPTSLLASQDTHSTQGTTAEPGTTAMLKTSLSLRH